ncbi:hypothetical protein NQZ68_007172 [Dissostichus eleginoides]|nr:hypothetical protein NQZ68_007172 [Dissostichus eleginoides]
MFWFGLPHLLPGPGDAGYVVQMEIMAHTWALAETPNKTPAWPQSLTELTIHRDLSHPFCGLTKICQHTINQPNQVS